MMQGDFDKAIAVAERFLKEKKGIPNYSRVVPNAAEVYLFANNEDKAMELYDNLFTRFRSFPSAGK